jgi:hypothetical protein
VGLFAFNGAGLLQFNWAPQAGANVVRDFSGIGSDQGLMGASCFVDECCGASYTPLLVRLNTVTYLNSFAAGWMNGFNTTRINFQVRPQAT